MTLCQQGRLVALDQHRAVVEIESGRACAACRAGKGCGMAIFGGWFARGPIRLALPPAQGWRRGDLIELRIAPRVLLRLAWHAYGAPLALLLAGLGAGALASPPVGIHPDLGAAVGGALGLVAGFALLRRRPADLPLAAARRLDSPDDPETRRFPL